MKNQMKNKPHLMNSNVYKEESACLRAWVDNDTNIIQFHSFGNFT